MPPQRQEVRGLPGRVPGTAWTRFRALPTTMLEPVAGARASTDAHFRHVQGQPENGQSESRVHCLRSSAVLVTHRLGDARKRHHEGMPSVVCVPRVWASGSCPPPTSAYNSHTTSAVTSMSTVNVNRSRSHVFMPENGRMGGTPRVIFCPPSRLRCDRGNLDVT